MAIATEPEAPALSVVISTLAMPDSLRRVLDRYERQRAPLISFEIVVVSDAAEPDPGAVKRAIGERPYPIRLVRGSRPGLSANRNAGARAARAPLLLYTDDDTLPRRRLVAEHLAWHRSHPEQEVAVIGRVRWARELRVTPFMRWLDHGVQFDHPNIRGTEAGWGRFYGANVSVKRAMVERAGGFDEERLPYGYEDIEFAYRASKLGLRVLYNRRAEVEHLRPMTLEFWQRRARRLAVAERTFVSMHPEIPPYFREKFAYAQTFPPASGRGVPMIPYVPAWLPWLGSRVWASADRYFSQAIAPHFLAAWEEAEGASESRAAQPDLSEREASSSGGSPPGGPK